MEIGEALAALEAAGTEQNRKVYARHGVGPSMYGVSSQEIGNLAKRIGHDHELALRLWATGNHDARVLATRVADPARFLRSELEAWVAEIDNYVLTDAFSGLVAGSPHARSLVDQWRDDPREWAGSCGWNLVALLADREKAIPESFFESCLQRIGARIRYAPNRVRHSMNQALIAIGVRNESLHRLAVQAAERIGVVEVDHGETSCETPAAIPYMQKILAHRSGRTGVEAELAGRAGARKSAVKKPGAKRPAIAAAKKRVAKKKTAKKSAKKTAKKSAKKTAKRTAAKGAKKTAKKKAKKRTAKSR